MKAVHGAHLAPVVVPSPAPEFTVFPECPAAFSARPPDLLADGLQSGNEVKVEVGGAGRINGHILGHRWRVQHTDRPS